MLYQIQTSLLQIKNNNRHAGASNWTMQEVAEAIKADYDSIDILVQLLANEPEVTQPLLETLCRGYVAVIPASTYSYILLLKYFAPIMNCGGCLSHYCIWHLRGLFLVMNDASYCCSAWECTGAVIQAGRKYDI